MMTARTERSWAIAVSASPSASSVASDRLLRACGRVRGRMATSSMSSRRRISAEEAAAARAAACAFIGFIQRFLRILTVRHCTRSEQPKIGKTGVGMTEMAPPKLTRKELTGLLRAEFPEMFNSESGYAIEKVWHGGAVV